MGKEEMAGSDGSGAYFVDAEIRSISLSPLCQGCESTFQVSVPFVSSTSALATFRDKDTEPSRAINSTVWPTTASNGMLYMVAEALLRVLASQHYLVVFVFLRRTIVVFGRQPSPDVKVRLRRAVGGRGLIARFFKLSGRTSSIGGHEESVYLGRDGIARGGRSVPEIRGEIGY